LNQDMGRFSVRVTAKKINKRNLILKFALVILLIAFLLLLTGYGLSMFVNNAGNFTVIIPDGDRGALSLSDTEDFTEPKMIIKADELPSMDNITMAWLPADLDGTDGAHNGENYIAHTFYLKNMGDEAVDYTAEINITATTLGADEAIRVMVIKNGETTVYAKGAKDSGQPEPDTIIFPGNTKVMSETYESFGVGDVDKYTVVIWLEGNDPECVDDILGGVVKMSMNFSVTDGTAFT